MERGRLVLSRKQGEGIAIGNGVEVFVQAVKGRTVKVAIVAPKDVVVRRTELEPKKAA